MLMYWDGKDDRDLMLWFSSRCQRCNVEGIFTRCEGEIWLGMMSRAEGNAVAFSEV
jgi:hypothetical protein